MIDDYFTVELIWTLELLNGDEVVHPLNINSGVEIILLFSLGKQALHAPCLSGLRNVINTNATRRRASR